MDDRLLTEEEIDRAWTDDIKFPNDLEKELKYKAGQVAEAQLAKILEWEAKTAAIKDAEQKQFLQVLIDQHMDTESKLREKLAEVLYGELTYRNYLAIPEVRHNADIMISKVLAIIKEAGYMKLAEDQSLSRIPSFSYDKEEDRKLLQRGAINYSKLLAGWRKVEGIE